MVECERCAAIHYVAKFHGGEKPTRPIQRAKHVSTYTWWSQMDFVEKSMSRWAISVLLKKKKDWRRILQAQEKHTVLDVPLRPAKAE